MNAIINYWKSTNTGRKVDKNDKKLQKDLKETLHFLKSTPNVYILKGDKGNTTAIFDKHEYIDKTSIMLTDKITYQIISRDLTTTVQNKLNRYWKLKVF